MDRRKTDRRLEGNRDLYVLDIQDLLDILNRRKALLIGFMLMALIPALLFVAFKPAVYEATTSVIMEEPDYSLTEFREAIPTARIDEMTLETQINLLKSPQLVQETLDKLGSKSVEVKKDQEAIGKKSGSDKTESTSERDAEMKAFIENFTVAPAGRSRVMTATYKSRDPQLAAEIVNTHTQSYIDYQIRSKREQLKLVNEWLAEQIEKLKKDSQVKSQAIQDYRTKSGIILGKNSQELIDQQITDLTLQLVPIETQKLNLQARAESIKAAGNSSAVPEIMSSSIVNDLKSQATAAQQELKSLSSQYGKDHPKVRSAKKKVAQIQSDIGRETSNIRKSVDIELESATTQEEMLRKRIEELSSESDQLRDKEIALEALQGELEANRKLLTNYMDRSQELKAQIDLSRPDVRVLDKADIPSSPSGMSKIILAALAVIFAIGFALTVTLLLELVDRGIESEDDVKKSLNLKLLGTLPKARNALAEIGGNTRSEFGEEIKRIYLLLSQRKVPQSILVTASRSGEGKSTVAVALAQYLASIRTKVVIVDADTSSPSIATMTGMNTSPGFAEIMAGRTEAVQAVQRDSKGLAAIAAGNTDSGVNLLASDAFSRMVTALKTQYDYVIIDCAPVQGITDAEIMAAQVDQVILVAEWASTPKKLLKKVASILRQHSKDVPNVILNKRS